MAERRDCGSQCSVERFRTVLCGLPDGHGDGSVKDHIGVGWDSRLVIWPAVAEAPERSVIGRIIDSIPETVDPKLILVETLIEAFTEVLLDVLAELDSRKRR